MDGSHTRMEAAVIAVLKPRIGELRVPGRSHHERLNGRHPMRTLVEITENALEADREIAKHNDEQTVYAETVLQGVVYDLRYLAARLDWILNDGYNPMSD